MSDTDWQAYGRLCAGVARATLVFLILVTFMLAAAALMEANPDAATDFFDSMLLGTVGGIAVHTVDVLAIVALFWSMEPFVRVVYGACTDIRAELSDTPEKST